MEGKEKSVAVGSAGGRSRGQKRSAGEEGLRLSFLLLELCEGKGREESEGKKKKNVVRAFSLLLSLSLHPLQASQSGISRLQRERDACQRVRAKEERTGNSNGERAIY